MCLNISTVINIKILTHCNQQTQSYKFTSHIAAFLSVVLITEMLEICIQTSYDQNVQLILKSYLPVVYGTTLCCVISRGATNANIIVYGFTDWGANTRSTTLEESTLHVTGTSPRRLARYGFYGFGMFRIRSLTHCVNYITRSLVTTTIKTVIINVNRCK